MADRRRALCILAAVAAFAAVSGCAASRAPNLPAAPVIEAAAGADPAEPAPTTAEAVAPTATVLPATTAVESAAVVVPSQAEVALALGQLEAANAATVRAFYELIFIEHRVAEAFNLYGGDIYIQHSPGLPDGRAAVEAALVPYFRDNPLARSEILRVVAQGDLVMLHVHAKADPVDRGRAVVEIFRLEAGKIVEHWDVIQPVPPGAENENSMF